MSGFFTGSVKQTVRYKNLNNGTAEEQSAEILIPSAIGENIGSEKDKGRFPQSRTVCLTISILTILLMVFGISGALFYYTHILHESNSRLEHNGSCASFELIDKLILFYEETDLNSCTDNTTCHSFLETIEQKHEGLQFNFVIGQEGELYIGAGFKCLVNSDEKVLYIKILRNRSLWLSSEICYRLTEIITHGNLCGKISPYYTIEIQSQHEDHKDGQDISDTVALVCSYLGSDNNRSYHVHDPGHETKLIHGDFGWTSCGNFSTTMGVKKHKIITLESFSKESCPPLQTVDEVLVDIVESPPLICYHYSSSSCMQQYEEHYEGFKYNFIINSNSNYNLYVGLGLSCRADGTFGSTLKIKVIRAPSHSDYKVTYYYQLQKYILLLEEAFACGKLSENFSVKVKCDKIYELEADCGSDYKRYNHIKLVQIEFQSHFPNFTIANRTIESEDGKGMVARWERYQFCHRNHTHNTSLKSKLNATMTSNLDQTTTGTLNNSCIPYQKANHVKIVFDKIKNDTLQFLTDSIIQEHDGMNYNFVIGPKGDFYIGAGFKCLINKADNDLSVKLFIQSSDDWSDELSESELCFRLAEIIQHGIFCGKISQHFTWVQHVVTNSSNAFHVVCKNFEFDDFKDRSYHIHDPGYNIGTFIPHTWRWTFCGNYDNKSNEENDKVMTLNSVPQNDCQPLQTAFEVLVDVEETSLLDCSDELSCLHIFEERHDGLKYNFIIGHDLEVYVGAGFKCLAEDTEEHVIKIKVLKKDSTLSYWRNNFTKEHLKLVEIFVEGISCGVLSKSFSLSINCLMFWEPESSLCKNSYEQFKSDYKDQILRGNWNIDSDTYKYYNISSENGRGIVPVTYTYKFCQKSEVEHVSEPWYYLDYYD